MPKSLTSSSSASEIPFTRRRLLPDQLATLQAVFEAKSHPSPEERSNLAAELGLELKAVNVWYQNKRRSVKKQAMSWKPSRNSVPAASQLSLSLSSSSNISNRSAISLDSIAEARQRPDTTPRTPKRHRPMEATENPQPIWELIPSSPNAPPSSPAADSHRLSALPATSKTMRSLEWACAKDRAGRKKRKRRHGAINIYDVPPLPSLTFSSKAEGTDTEVEEIITPDTSMELASLQTPVRKRCTEEDCAMEDGQETPHLDIDMDVEAAIALLGFKVRS